LKPHLQLHILIKVSKADPQAESFFLQEQHRDQAPYLTSLKIKLEQKALLKLLVHKKNLTDAENKILSSWYPASQDNKHHHNIKFKKKNLED
jgi:hypothetical protein